MNTIGFIQVFSKKYGGVMCLDQSRDILSQYYDLELVDLGARFFKHLRYLKLPESLLYLLKLKGEKDVWIRDFYSVLTLPFDRTKGKNIAVIFHIDFSQFPLFSRPFLILFEKLFFYRGLKKADAIVVISDYWEKYFRERGYKNIYKVYWGPAIKDFDISQQEINAFKKKYKLEDKPILYLGNCQRAKGVVESYDALKDLDVHLVTSGRRQVKIPALNLNLERREFLTLLKASSIAITMSKFKEGLCYTTQEAMLSGTPVIGSGRGGMRELLEGGRQIICPDFVSLRDMVEYLLRHSEEREKIGKDAYEFAKQFTRERFEKEWLAVMDKLL